MNSKCAAKQEKNKQDANKNMMQDMMSMFQEMLKKIPDGNQRGQIINNMLMGNQINNTMNQVFNITAINGVPILPFGQENRSYITRDNAKKWLDAGGSKTAIMESMKYLHCNKDHPENMNVICPDIKSDEIFVFRESKKWEKETIDILAPEIIQHAIDAIMDFDVQPSEDKYVNTLLEIADMRDHSICILNERNIKSHLLSNYMKMERTLNAQPLMIES